MYRLINYILAFIILLFVCCSARETTIENIGKRLFDDLEQNQIDSIVGILTLSSSFKDDDTVYVFNEDGSVWYQFSFVYDDSDGKYDYYNKSFKPLSFNPDSYTFAVKVLSQKREYFKVIVNEDSGLSKYIRFDSTKFKFESLSDYILNSFSVSFDFDSNPILKSIEGEKIEVSKSNYTVYPKAIQGDWLNVEYKNHENNQIVNGWIRWKEKNKLLIFVHSD